MTENTLMEKPLVAARKNTLAPCTPPDSTFCNWPNQRLERTLARFMFFSCHGFLPVGKGRSPAVFCSSSSSGTNSSSSGQCVHLFTACGSSKQRSSRSPLQKQSVPHSGHSCAIFFPFIHRTSGSSLPPYGDGSPAPLDLDKSRITATAWRMMCNAHVPIVATPAENERTQSKITNEVSIFLLSKNPTNPCTLSLSLSVMGVVGVIDYFHLPYPNKFYTKRYRHALRSDALASVLHQEKVRRRLVDTLRLA